MHADFAVEIMRAAGIAEWQIHRLTALRAMVESGTVNDRTFESNHLRFMRILWLSGCFHSDGGPISKRLLRRAA